MKRVITLLIFLFLPGLAYADARIKDMVNFEGIRDNVLIGYGLVVGLNGTGDNLKNSVFTEKGLADFLEKLGVNTRGANLKTKNVAAVTVTATLHPFARNGSRLSVDVSTIGDAKSLKGGTLLATPLLGADGEVYAVAQGPISIGQKSADDPSKPDVINPTAGFLNNGAIVEREINFQLENLTNIKLALKNPDITTAHSLEQAINLSMKEKMAVARDPGTVEIAIPKKYQGKTLDLLSEIENINIYPDVPARIIIDEATGTIVIGENVNISKVAVAQGNLIVKVQNEKSVLEQLGLVAPNAAKPEKGSDIAVLNETASLSDLVKGLNALGVKPKDLVAILKSIKDAGALHAEIISR